MVKINREKTIFDVLYSKQAFLNNKNIGFKNPRGEKGLQGVEDVYKGLQGVTGGDKGLQGVTKDYRNFFLTRTFPDTFCWSILHKNQT